MNFLTADLEDAGEDIGQDFLESPVSDGTIEENFEEELVNAPKVGTIIFFTHTLWL